jgi:hypothetical protein
MLGGSKLDQLDAAFDGVELTLRADQLERLNAVDRHEWAAPYAKP